MRRDEIENGMVARPERAGIIHVCPHCGAEWERIVDRGTVWYAWEWELVRKYPMAKGFCRACAAASASGTERVRFLREEGLEFAFCGWLFESERLGEHRPGYVREVFELMAEHDPEFLEQMAGQFIEDERLDEFIAWRCGGESDGDGQRS